MRMVSGEWYFCMYRTDIAPGGLWRDVSSWVAEIERYGSVPHWVPHCVPHCVPNVSVYVFCLSHRETLARQTFLGKRWGRYQYCSASFTSLVWPTRASPPSRLVRTPYPPPSLFVLKGEDSQQWSRDGKFVRTSRSVRQFVRRKIVKLIINTGKVWDLPL